MPSGDETGEIGVPPGSVSGPFDQTPNGYEVGVRLASLTTLHAAIGSAVKGLGTPPPENIADILLYCQASLNIVVVLQSIAPQYAVWVLPDATVFLAVCGKADEFIGGLTTILASPSASPGSPPYTVAEVLQMGVDLFP